MPKISVIMVAWNSGPLLGAAVAGVRAQTETDWEFLLVDNGSVDGCVEAALAGIADPRIRVLRQERNLGTTGGIVAGLAHATGRYIALHDHDDVSHPQRFAMQVAALDTHAELAAVSCGARIIDERGRPHELMPCLSSATEIRDYAAFNPPATHPTLFLRREVFAAVSYRSRFGIADDYDFVVRACEKFDFGAVSLPLYLYRSHGGSATVQWPLEAEANACAVRLCTARRRAGRPEDLNETTAEVAAMLDANASASQIYARFAQLALAEGFPALEALHAALAVRSGARMGDRLLYLRSLFAWARGTAGGWKILVGGAAKGPFWAVLREHGMRTSARY